ncbi:putative glycosidase CRH2 [Entomophthora muscae]|uniref:Glycosidase CRH2 n=1 Tax=Entomophthora muscae TaxID=34485 RepID=A0ACC2S341_9FUNG|nr:putative glycosidase CRH2 [Entomophthora muscae]
MRLFILLAVSALEVVTVENKKCHINLGSCDQWSPCCNTDGWCGTGFSHCGSTCFEAGNHNGTKCMPEPKCITKKYTVADRHIAPKANYNGNYTNTDFIVEGDYQVRDSTVILKMSRPKTGTTMYSTRYMQYGRASARIKTSRTGGVVSSFILMAKDKDEVDFEWVGNKQTETQTNWYSKGKFPIWPPQPRRQLPHQKHPRQLHQVHH